MARILCNVAGGGKPLKGNAETGDVLAGKTFSNKQSNALTGSMPNQGGYTASKSWARGNGTTYIRIPKGAYLTAANNGLDLPEVTVADNLYGQKEYDNNYSSGYTNGRNSAHLVTYKGLQVDGSIYAILEVDGQQKCKENAANMNFTTYIGNTSINIRSSRLADSSVVAHLYINGTEVFNDNIPNIYHYGRSLIVYV